MYCECCERSCKEIIGNCTCKNSVKGSLVEVLYLTSRNKLICSRCALENVTTLKYGGRAVISHVIGSASVRVLKDALGVVKEKNKGMKEKNINEEKAFRDILNSLPEGVSDKIAENKFIDKGMLKRYRNYKGSLSSSNEKGGKK